MQVPPLARSALDRDHASRLAPDAVDRALEDPSTRIIAVAGDRAPVRDGALVRFAPDALGSGLLLHLSTEILAEDVHQSRHLDPLLRDERDRVPPGFGLFRQRRFAASRSLLEPLAAWARETEMDLQAVEI